MSILSLAVWWIKLEKNDKVRHNMTQIASLIVVVTVFTWLMICNVCILQSEKGGLYARQKLHDIVPIQELELNMRWGGGDHRILKVSI